MRCAKQVEVGGTQLIAIHLLAQSEHAAGLCTACSTHLLSKSGRRVFSSNTTFSSTVPNLMAL